MLKVGVALVLGPVAVGPIPVTPAVLAESPRVVSFRLPAEAVAFCFSTKESAEEFVVIGGPHVLQKSNPAMEHFKAAKHFHYYQIPALVEPESIVIVGPATIERPVAIYTQLGN